MQLLIPYQAHWLRQVAYQAHQASTLEPPVTHNHIEKN